MTSTPDETPETGIEESDPNADSDVGLAGDLGVSSERRGPVRGHDEAVTYATAPTFLEQDSSDEADSQAPPEQSASDGRPEVQPDSPGPHHSDPAANPRHGV